jgi:hypothetical protein
LVIGDWWLVIGDWWLVIGDWWRFHRSDVLFTTEAQRHRGFFFHLLMQVGGA